MQRMIEQRLNELRAEFESGKDMMAELESKSANIRDTLMCISGAIHVLEEIIAIENDTLEVPFSS